KAPDEARIASIMKDALDDFVQRLRPGDVLAGDPIKGASALKVARDLWARGSKADAIENLIERARNRAGQFSGSGYENALRTEFRAFVRNRRNLRGFTADERAALQRVARGGPIENALRYLGKLAPTGIVSAALSGGAGAAMGGPVGAAALPALGFLARQGATA